MHFNVVWNRAPIMVKKEGTPSGKDWEKDLGWEFLPNDSTSNKWCSNPLPKPSSNMSQASLRTEDMNFIVYQRLTGFLNPMYPNTPALKLSSTQNPSTDYLNLRNSTDALRSVSEKKWNGVDSSITRDPIKFDSNGKPIFTESD